jgi:hypothetical protein
MAERGKVKRATDGRNREGKLRRERREVEEEEERGLEWRKTLWQGRRSVSGNVDNGNNWKYWKSLGFLKEMGAERADELEIVEWKGGIGGREK